MSKKKVCICFDYENDRQCKTLMKSWDAHSAFNFSFNDVTPNEIHSDDYNKVKESISQKINGSKYVLVIVGSHCNDKDPRSLEIGAVNWLNWEIKKARELGKKLVAVKTTPSCTCPDELLDSGASWAMNFTKEDIIKAIERA